LAGDKPPALRSRLVRVRYYKFGSLLAATGNLHPFAIVTMSTLT